MSDPQCEMRASQEQRTHLRAGTPPLKMRAAEGWRRGAAARNRLGQWTRRVQLYVDVRTIFPARLISVL